MEKTFRKQWFKEPLEGGHSTCASKKKKNNTNLCHKVSGTKLLTHHSLRMCFKLTTLQKTCNHYHHLALPKKKLSLFHYIWIVSNQSQWMAPPAESPTPDSAFTTAITAGLSSPQSMELLGSYAQLRELVEGTTSFWNRTDTQKKKRKIKTERWWRMPNE